MNFIPSHYSAYGATVEATSGGASTLKIAGTAANTTATALSVAAAGSTAVGPVGWVVAGVLGAAAGTIVLITEIKHGKKNRKAAVKWAKQIGLPDPDEAARFIVKVATKDKKWRDKELAQQKRQITRKKGRRETKGRTRRMDRDIWKRDVLIAYRRYLKTGNVRPAPSSSAQVFRPTSPGSRSSSPARRRRQMPTSPQAQGFVSTSSPQAQGFVSTSSPSAAPAGLSPAAMAALAIFGALAIGGVVYGVQKGRP